MSIQIESGKKALQKMTDDRNYWRQTATDELGRYVDLNKELTSTKRDLENARKDARSFLAKLEKATGENGRLKEKIEDSADPRALGLYRKAEERLNTLESMRETAEKLLREKPDSEKVRKRAADMLKLYNEGIEDAKYTRDRWYKSVYY